MIKIKIEIVPNPETKKFELWAKTPYFFNPCGPRLRKDGDFPDDGFIFKTEKEAKKACVKLQAYVDVMENQNEHRERKREKYQEERTSIFGQPPTDPRRKRNEDMVHV